MRSSMNESPRRPSEASPAPPDPARSRRRRNALIATSVALPVTVVLAFAFTAGGSGDGGKTSTGPLPAVVISAPPSPDDATQAACVKVFAQLPVQLEGLNPRKTDADSSFVAAWGDPPITFRCGVSKPPVFGTPAAAQLIDVDGVIWQPDPQKDVVVYTAVDRSVYIEVTVPTAQTQPLTDVAPAVSALPQVCTASDAAGNPTNPKLKICGS
jgi:hypothetical protein